MKYIKYLAEFFFSLAMFIAKNIFKHFQVIYFIKYNLPSTLLLQG